MVLVDLLRELSFHIVVAHCNFQLRGEDSDRDEMFVKSYCEKHNICFHAKPFETKLPKHSTQMAARTLRYEWFNQLCSDNDYDYILTAHHADDAIEMANDSNFGLSAGVFTQDVDAAVRFAKEIDCGNVHINGGPLWRTDLMPYGGIKDSGLGKEGPKYAIDEMTEMKSVVIHS